MPNFPHNVLFTSEKEMKPWPPIRQLQSPMAPRASCRLWSLVRVKELKRDSKKLSTKYKRLSVLTEGCFTHWLVLMIKLR